MEDGEIADSDDEACLHKTGLPSNFVTDAQGMGVVTNSFPSRDSVLKVPLTKTLAVHRNPCKKTASSESESSQGELSDDGSDRDSACSRPDKHLHSAAVLHRAPAVFRQSCADSNGSLLPSSSGPRKPGAIRKNDVWGSVLTEQILSQDLVDVGVAKRFATNERNVESYDYRRAAPWSRRSSASDDSSADEDEENSSVSGAISLSTSSNSSSRSHSKERLVSARDPTYTSSERCRLPVKDRLGKAPESLTNVTSQSPPDAVAAHIAVSLQEPKSTLISRVVETLGTEKALSLFHRTRDVEDAGGMMTMDGSRRRTPGGVFIILMKSDKEVTKLQLRQIFALEVELEKEKEKKKRKRKRNQIMAIKKSKTGAEDSAMTVDTVGKNDNCPDDAALLADDPDFSIE